MRKTLFLIVSMVFTAQLWSISAVQAQISERLDREEPTPTFPLKGKTVAVYFSKKHFTFNQTYRIPLSQFIKSDKGEEEEIENLKSQTLISLGTLFSTQLKDATQADSVYFLNEYPEKARAFISNYSSDTRELQPIPTEFAGTDYVLVVNPLILGSYKTSAVFTRSNRIHTQQVTVKSGRIRFELFDPEKGLLMFLSKACLDERKDKVPERHFEFHIQHSKTGRFLGDLFSLAVTHLNTGVPGNCDQNGE